MSSIDEQKNCTISLAFSQGANSVLSMERNNAVLFSSHRKRGHVLFCRSMYPPSPDKEEKRNRPKADGPLLSIPAANRHGYPTRPHRSSRISIHDPRAGIDVQSSPQTYQSVVFQSTTPVRGSTRDTPNTSLISLFQSTTPVRGSTYSGTWIIYPEEISIHDPRAGIDPNARPDHVHIRLISIHDPRAGIDDDYRALSIAIYNFNPRPPCGDRRLPDLIRT